MSLHLDPASRLPLYHQIREQLRDQILDGRLKPGDPLPSEAQIGAATGVSRMTARQALGLLALEGLVVRQRGRGTFVAPAKATLPSAQSLGMSYSEIVGQTGQRAGAQVRSQEVAAAPAVVASHLRLAPGAAVVCIVRQRSVSGEAMSLETSYYPYSRFPELAQADLTDASLHRLMLERYSVAPAYATDTVEIAVAGPYEAGELGMAEGGPIARVTTVAYQSDDTPLAYTTTIHRGDRFRAVIRRARPPLD